MIGGDALKAELLAELAELNRVARPREGDFTLVDYMTATDLGYTAAKRRLKDLVTGGTLETEKVLGANGHWRWVWRRKEEL